MRTSFSFYCAISSDLPTRAVEIGVAKGHNSAEMLIRYPGLTLWSVDPYEHCWYTGDHSKDLNGRVEFTKEEREQTKAEAKKLLDNFNGRCKLVHKSSVEASKDFPDEFFDYIYIDGDHEISSVRQDIEAWYPKLKKYGVFAGHDYNGECVGVVIPVNEFHEKIGRKFLTGYDGDWWSIKE